MSNKRIFISHASEDKDNYVRALAKILCENNFDVWYDEYEIQPGISIRQSIDKGLRACDIGLIVLSPAYIKKQWTTLELNAIFSKITMGYGKLIPIWLNITKKELFDYSPLLTDFLAIDGSKPLLNVVMELKRIIYPEKTTLEKTRILIENVGLETPDFNDDWWLNVIRFSGQDVFSVSWSLPINPKKELDLFEEISWSALRYNWVTKYSNLWNQFTSPDVIEHSILNTPGMQEIIEINIDFVLTYAPQLLFSNNCLSKLIQNRRLLLNSMIKNPQSSRYKCSLTNDSLVPTCNRIFALCENNFGKYKSSYILQHFVEGESLGARPSNLGYWEVLILLNSKYAKIYPKPVQVKLLNGYRNFNSYSALSKRIVNDSFGLGEILKDHNLLKRVCEEIVEDNLSSYDLDLNNIVTAIQGLRIEENLTNEKEYRRLTISQEDLALNFRGVTRQSIYK